MLGEHLAEHLDGRHLRALEVAAREVAKGARLTIDDEPKSRAEEWEVLDATVATAIRMARSGGAARRIAGAFVATLNTAAPSLRAELSSDRRALLASGQWSVVHDRIREAVDRISDAPDAADTKQRETIVRRAARACGVPAAVVAEAFKSQRRTGKRA